MSPSTPAGVRARCRAASLLLDAPTLAAVAALGLGAAVIGGMAVVPVLAVAGVIINAGRFWFYRASLDRRALARVLAASLPFLVLGTWIYTALDARSLGTVLGLVVMASVPVRRFLHSRKIVLGKTGIVAGAGVFGLASGVATGTGVIL